MTSSPASSTSLKQPIFIVGLPRTGSKLLMNVINNNRRADYCIANEIQFFGHSTLGRILQGRRGIMTIVDSERDSKGSVRWERVVERLYSGEAKGVHWNGLTAGWIKVPKEQLLKSLSQTDGSPRAVYSAILSTQEREFAGYGDKSGPNLYFIAQLLDWFPDGKVLHIIRDPRAILTSQHKRLMSMLEHNNKAGSAVTVIKKAFYSPIIVLYILTYWGRAIRLDRQFSRGRPKNYFSVRFEELLTNPEETTRSICTFLGVPWDEKMVQPPKRDSSYIDPADVQKKMERGTGMDCEATDRWRRHIRPWMQLVLALYGGLFYPKALDRFGYGDARRL